MPLLADQSQVATTDHTGVNTESRRFRWWDTNQEDTKLLFAKTKKEDGELNQEQEQARIRLANDVFATAEQIFLNMRPTRIIHYYFNLMYHDVDHGTAHTPQLGAYNYDVDGFHTEGSAGATLNVAQSAVDTAAAMISKNKPKPQFLTNGAKDNKDKITAQNATKYVQGIFDDQDVYTKMQEAFTEAGIIGTGALKVSINQDKKKIEIDWVFTEEILVDWLDGRNKKPTQMHYKHYYSRDELLDKYPQFRQQILADTGGISGNATYRSVADVVAVIESWHLPTSDKMDDGLHTVSIKGFTLLCEKYTKNYFPFIFFRWYPHTPGFWGRGLIAEIANLYLQINKHLDTVDEALDLLANAYWLVEKNSGVSEEEMSSNEIGKQIYYTGTAPELVAPNVVPQEMYQHIWNLENHVYSISGVSQQTASGSKEDDGVTSAVGMQEVADIATGRFEVVAQRYEQAHIELAEICMDLSADLYADHHDLSIEFQEKHGIVNLSFKDANIKECPYRIQCFPISGLPYSPAGRMDRIMQYVDAGWLTQEEGKALLDFPDLEDVISLQTATTTFVANVLSSLKEGGEYVEPLPELDLTLAFNLASAEVVRATNEKVPEDAIKLIRQFKVACNTLLMANQQMQAAMHPQGPPNPVMAQPMQANAPGPPAGTLPQQ